jgi:hypothetical protein
LVLILFEVSMMTCNWLVNFRTGPYGRKIDVG